MKNVSFITTENDEDLIVSFAIAGASVSEVKSLTLLRPPKYDFILDDSERGVRVSDEACPDNGGLRHAMAERTSDRLPEEESNLATMDSDEDGRQTPQSVPSLYGLWQAFGVEG